MRTKDQVLAVASLSLARFRGDVERIVSISSMNRGDGGPSRMRRGAIKSIAKRDDPAARRFIAESLVDDPDPVVRSYAAVAMSFDSIESVAGPLADGLADPDERVFASCSDSLLRLGVPAASTLINGYIGGQSSRAKIAVAQSTAHALRADEATAVLNQLARDADPSVRRAAIAALEPLAQKDAVALAEAEIPRAGMVDRATYKNIVHRAGKTSSDP